MSGEALGREDARVRPSVGMVDTTGSHEYTLRHEKKHNGNTALSPTAISNAEYNEFRTFLEDACGIVLGENKQYLVSSRLTRIMTEYKMDSMGKLIASIRRSEMKGLRDKIVEAMTTNETSWFRDGHPFKTLEEVIFPELGKEKRNPVRIWSAACSAGQEPYSISMTVQEFQTSNPGLLSGNIQIVATDISPAILSVGEAGRYDAMAMARGLDEERKRKFFKTTPAYSEVIPQVRARVQFRELNLLKSYALLGKFDVIFCRNVLIYFSSECKRDIINRMASSLNPGGYLFLGGSESLTGVSEAFEMIRTRSGVVYRLRL